MTARGEGLSDTTDPWVQIRDPRIKILIVVIGFWVPSWGQKSSAKVFVVFSDFGMLLLEVKVWP